jgi:hypothetical protein
MLTITLDFKMDPATKKCVPDTDEADRKGGCPGKQVLDEKWGPSDDPKAERKCKIDDRETCKPPNIPETRKDGDELKTEVKPECGRKKDGDKDPNCNKRTEYESVFVDSEGFANRKCVPTKNFEKRKKEKPEKADFKQKVKDIWNKNREKFKQQRETKEKAEKDLKSEREKQAKEEKERAENDKKETDKKIQAKRVKYQCEVAVDMLEAAAQWVRNRKKSKRAGADEIDAYTYTSLFFEEGHITDDARLKELPKEVDLNKIADDVDYDSFLKTWDKYIDDHKPLYTGGCNYSKRSSLGARCSQRRSMDEEDGDTDPDDELDWLDASSYNMSSLAQRDLGPDDEPAMTIGNYKERLQSLESRNLSEIEKRQAQALLGLLARLVGWGTRFAQSLASRAASTVANSSPTLYKIMGKDAKLLFQAAKDGKGTSGGGQAMTKSSEWIWKTRRDDMIKCMMTGLPL